MLDEKAAEGIVESEVEKRIYDTPGSLIEGEAMFHRPFPNLSDDLSSNDELLDRLIKGIGPPNGAMGRHSRGTSSHPFAAFWTFTPPTLFSSRIQRRGAFQIPDSRCIETISFRGNIRAFMGRNPLSPIWEIAIPFKNIPSRVSSFRSFNAIT